MIVHVKPTVYIETTIPSFYCSTRSDAESVARTEWTRRWWDERRASYQLIRGFNVRMELTRAPGPLAGAAIQLVEEVPELALSDEIREIVRCYIAQKVMPGDPLGDALHLAFASRMKADFLLTWNCRHLANAMKYRHIVQINQSLGLYTPQMVTPMEMLEVDPNEG